MGSLFIDGDFLWYVFGFQKDRIKFIWEETDASTEEVFKDISFGFDITNDIGKTMQTVEGKNETLRVSSKKNMMILTFGNLM